MEQIEEREKKEEKKEGEGEEEGEGEVGKGEGEIVIIGAGGFCKQVIEGFCLNGIKIRGLIDDKITGYCLDYNIIGKIDDLIYMNKNIKFFCAIGDVKTRSKLYSRFPDRWINCIHPNATISKYSTMGTGNYIGPGCCIMPNVNIGNNNIIDCLAVISHDCTIGNHNHLAGHSCLLGNVSIGDCNLIGANSTILPKLIINSNIVLGAGAVLTKSIDSDKVMIGIPAREWVH